MAKGTRIALVLVLAAAVGLAFVSSRPADAQGQTIKIGLLYDHTAPSRPPARSTAGAAPR